MEYYFEIEYCDYMYIVNRMRASYLRAGAIGATGVAMAAPIFGPPSKNGDIFKPRYIHYVPRTV